MLPAIRTFAAADLQASHELRGKVISVAASDTLRIVDAEKTQPRIRISGIDAPGRGQVFGTKSRESLASAVHETVRVVWKEKDRYGRIVGDVLVRSFLG